MAAPAYGLLFLLLLLPLLFSVCQEQQQQQQTLAVAAETALNDPWKHDGTHEEAAEERYAKSYRHGYDDDDEEEDEKQQYHAPPARHIHRDDDGKRSHGGRSRQSEHRFVLDIDDDDDDDDRSSLIHTTVFSTEAGELKFLSPRINCDDDDNQNNQELARERIGLSFLTLEPNALLLPQYTHSDCLFVVIKGGGLLSWIDGEDLQKLELEEGDVYRIESGTVFYFLNHDENQKMHVFGIHDLDAGGSSRLSSVIRDGGFFTVAGAETVLSGFDEDVLSTAFNVSGDEVYDLLTSRRTEGGPIIYHALSKEERNESSSSAPSSSSSSSSSSSTTERRNVVADVLLEDTSALLLRSSILKKKEEESPGKKKKKPLNIFQKKPMFTNEYGSTSVVDETDSELLKQADKGVFSVKLKASAMLAPHWNPRGMEIALVTKGAGEIQVVVNPHHFDSHSDYSDSRSSRRSGGGVRERERERVREGSVFYVPRNYAMCQVASTHGPLEFVGFSTSSRPNHPQFLAGSSSVLRKVEADVVASAFNVPADYAQRFLGRQAEAVILPGVLLLQAEEEAAAAAAGERRQNRSTNSSS